jgi:uncharacterized protein YcbX
MTPSKTIAPILLNSVATTVSGHANFLRRSTMHLSGLFVYPVKSLRGFSVTSAELDALGLVGDRRFIVIDGSGRFLTQRTLPRMALVCTALSADTLTLSAAGCGDVRIMRNSDSAVRLRTVSVWGSEDLQAEDCGDSAATWLSDFLRVQCRLLRAGPRFQRRLKRKGNTLTGDVLGFADAFPFLILGEASLADLNGRILAQNGDPLPMDRFRPNLVLSGSNPYAEGDWPRIRVGRIVLRTGGPCARCVVTTTDQQTAERGKEPLRTLATYRRDAEDPSKVNFGQNFIHETKSGTLTVGAQVEILPA